MNITCCLCIRNCEKFLPNIFKNLDSLNKKFNNLSIIFVYDNCSDNTEKLLKEYTYTKKYNVFLINNNTNTSPHRTQRIANARNKAIEFMYKTIKTDFHFMIDADDVNCNEWNIDLIEKYLLIDTWDSLSFNRPNYYDMWALLYGDFKHHCWGFKNNSVNVIEYMKKDIIDKLDNLKLDELFECISAFNGFAIYRTPVFKNITYDGLYSNIKNVITDYERQKNLEILRKHIPNLYIDENHIEICEHIFYHVNAIKQNNARIRISKFCLFNSNWSKDLGIM